MSQDQLDLFPIEIIKMALAIKQQEAAQTKKE